MIGRLVMNIFKNVRSNIKVNRETVYNGMKVYTGFGCLVGVNGAIVEHHNIVQNVYKQRTVDKHLQSLFSHVGAFYIYTIIALEYPLYGLCFEQSFNTQIESLRSRGWLCSKN